MRKTFKHSRSEYDERVVLRSDAFTSGWEVEHQRPDGRVDHLTTDALSRESAFELAERKMAEISNVHPELRTGRAAE